MATARKTVQTRSRTIELPVGENGVTPRIIIVGRGSLTGTMEPDETGTMQPSRQLQALRIRRKTMDRVKSLVAGPAYLAVDLLLQRACDVLEKEDRIEAVRAEDLER